LQKVITGILASVLVSAGVVPAAASAASLPAVQKAAVANVETIYRMEHQVFEETTVLQGNTKALVSILKTLPASVQRRIDWEQVKMVERNATKAIAQAKHDANLPIDLKRPKNLATTLRDDALHLRLDLAVVIASNRAVLSMTREVQSMTQPGSTQGTSSTQGTTGTSGTSGTTGTSNGSGTSSASGTSGTSGTSSTAGASSTPTTTGSQGPSGQQ
jgi:hypothetical protein